MSQPWLPSRRWYFCLPPGRWGSVEEEGAASRILPPSDPAPKAALGIRSGPSLHLKEASGVCRAGDREMQVHARTVRRQASLGTGSVPAIPVLQAVARFFPAHRRRLTIIRAMRLPAIWKTG